MDYGAKGDGTTNDLYAITRAFNEAQSSEVDLYFPAGTYNFNGLHLRAKENIRIFGDGESTVLYNPGSLYVEKDVAIENLSVFKRNGVFVYIQPVGYSNVVSKNVKVYNDLKVAEDAIYMYCWVSQVGSNRGVNNVTFTNNNMTKLRGGMLLKCEVKSGLVDNNTLTDFGDPNKNQGITGLTVGMVDDDNRWIPAENVTISNNTIKGVYSLPRPGNDYSGHLVYSIVVVGNNITIKNNHVENQGAYTGIYAKVNNLLISDNTLINAGDYSSICVKAAGPMIIENNNITSSVDDRGAIRVHASDFIIRNNKIIQNHPVGGGYQAAAISHESIPIKSGLIEGNEVYTELDYGILISAVDGNVAIKNNNITQKISAPPTIVPGAIHVRGASATSVLDCLNNNIMIEKGMYVLYCSGSNVDGSVINFTNNTVVVPENTNYLFSPYGVTFNMIGNDITIKRDPSLDDSTERKGLISANYAPCLIENNIIRCERDSMPNMFSLKLYTRLNNTIIYGYVSPTPVVSKTPTVNDLTCSIPTNHVYNGKAQGIGTVTAKAGATGLGAITVKYNGSATAPINEGTYKVTVDIAAGTNYSAATGLSLGNYTIAAYTDGNDSLGNGSTGNSPLGNGSAGNGSAGSGSSGNGFSGNGSAGSVTAPTETAPVTVESTWNSPFVDVKKGDWFYDDVAYACINNMMTGTNTAPKLFSPNMPLTRCMTVAVLYRMADSPDVTGLANPFSDVAEGKWYTNAVKWAAHNKIVSGYGNGKFNPDNNITRQDLAITLAQYTDFAGINLPVMRDYQGFKDDANIAGYAEEAITQFFRAGIMSGKLDNRVDPKGEATRAELASMLHRFLDAAKDE